MSVKSPSLSDAHHSRAIISGFPKAMERAGRLIGFRDAVRQAPAGDVQMCQIGSRRFWADSNGGRLTPDNFGQPRQITTTVEGRDAIPKHPRRPAIAVAPEITSLPAAPLPPQMVQCDMFADFFATPARHGVSRT